MKVHKVKVWIGYWKVTECAQENFYNASLAWHEVTCKKCLKKRGKR